MKEKDVQLAIIRNWYSSNNIMIPNVTGGCGEMDVLRLTRAGYATEFEVKISRRDFFHDKVKICKHKTYSDIFIGATRLTWDGKPDDNVRGIPNYFIYVVPFNLKLTARDVPAYAGLFELTEHGYIEVVKSAPRIHKQVHRDFWIEVIARSLNAKYLYHYFFREAVRI